MTTASNPGPQNIILLAGLGIGAYWLMTRRAMAAPVAAGQPAASGFNLNALAGLAGQLFRGNTSQNLYGTADGRSMTQWDVTPQGAGGPMYNNPSAYTSAAVDGLAYNPVNNSPWNASQGWGSGDAFGNQDLGLNF